MITNRQFYSKIPNPLIKHAQQTYCDNKFSKLFKIINGRVPEIESVKKSILARAPGRKRQVLLEVATLAVFLYSKINSNIWLGSLWKQLLFMFL